MLKTKKKMKVFNLIPTNGRKSFYRKARVIDDGITAKLISYETIVAEIELNTMEYTQHGDFSKTTNIHIKCFKEFYGI